MEGREGRGRGRVMEGINRFREVHRQVAGLRCGSRQEGRRGQAREGSNCLVVEGGAQ